MVRLHGPGLEWYGSVRAARIPGNQTMRYPLSETGTTRSGHIGFLFVDIKTQGTVSFRILRMVGTSWILTTLSRENDHEVSYQNSYQK